MAGRYDIELVQGDTFEKIFEWYDPTGLPIDLSNYSAVCKFRTTSTDPEAQVSLSDEQGGGILFVDPANGYAIDPTKGSVYVQITAEQSATIALPGGWWALKLFSYDGANDFTLAYGQYKVFPQVTE